MVIKHNTEALIPVIDVSEHDPQVAEDLIAAVVEWGFVYVHGHIGFTTKEIDGMFATAKRFFASPKEEKAKVHISPNNRGWSSMHSEILDQGVQKRGDCKEAFNFGEFVHGGAQQPLPGSLKAHESDVNRFASLCHNLCIKLLRLFALGLKINADEGGDDWFSSRHDQTKGPSGTILRLLYYPALSSGAFDYDAAEDIRAGAHSDYGSLTLLFQRPSQPGLEIQTPASSWSPVPVFPHGTEADEFPPVLVNIGDLLSYWTNGLLKSTVHRVVLPSGGGDDRYSIAYFCHPIDDAPLIPVPSDVVNKTRKGTGKNEDENVLTAAQHLKRRLAATYGWEKGTDPASD